MKPDEQQNRWKVTITSPDGLGLECGFDNAKLAASGFAVLSQALELSGVEQRGWERFCEEAAKAGWIKLNRPTSSFCN